MGKPGGKLTRSNGSALLPSPRSISDLAGLRSMVHPFFGDHHRYIQMGHTKVEVGDPPDMSSTFESLGDNFFGLGKRYKFFPLFLEGV